MMTGAVCPPVRALEPCWAAATWKEPSRAHARRNTCKLLRLGRTYTPPPRDANTALPPPVAAAAGPRPCRGTARRLPLLPAKCPAAASRRDACCNCSPKMPAHLLCRRRRAPRTATAQPQWPQAAPPTKRGSVWQSRRAPRPPHKAYQGGLWRESARSRRLSPTRERVRARRCGLEPKWLRS